MCHGRYGRGRVRGSAAGEVPDGDMHIASLHVEFSVPWELRLRGDCGEQVVHRLMADLSDTERMDWLAQQLPEAEWAVVVMRFSGFRWETSDELSLRDTIDAAMQAERAEHASG